MRVSCKKSRARNIRGPSEVLQTDRLLGDSGPGAAWVHSRESLVVVFYGSSSCAPIPVDLTVDAPDSIAAEFAQNASEVCTSDLAANTFRFDTPVASTPTATSNWSSP